MSRLSLCPSCQRSIHVTGLPKPRSLVTSARPKRSTIVTYPQQRFLSFSPRALSQSPRDILSEPTWSVASLLDDDPSPASPNEKGEAGTSASKANTISPSTLHHLLRLSALPHPATPEAESFLLSSLQSHLRFVRAIQAVDTSGVEPLRALRDETAATGRAGATVSLADMKEALDGEVRFGHRKRPRRVRSASTERAGAEHEETRAAEDWQPLATAGRRAGKFFVVQSRKDTP